MHTSEQFTENRRAGVTIGSVEGDTFTMNNEGMVLAYRPQMETPLEPLHE